MWNSKWVSPLSSLFSNPLILLVPLVLPPFVINHPCSVLMIESSTRVWRRRCWYLGFRGWKMGNLVQGNRTDVNVQISARPLTPGCRTPIYHSLKQLAVWDPGLLIHQTKGRYLWVVFQTNWSDWQAHRLHVLLSSSFALLCTVLTSLPSPLITCKST
jgi:hypothetical protein